MCTIHNKKELRRHISILKRHKASWEKIDIDKTKPYIELCKELFEKYPDCYATILKRGYKLYELDQAEIPEFKYLVDWINSQTPLLQDPFYTFSTKLYWIFNGLTDFPICARECCTNVIGIHSNVKINRGYNDYCCNRCAQKAEETIAKVKHTKLVNHGDENYINIDKIRETTRMNLGVDCSFLSPEVINKCWTTKAEHIAENPNYWKDKEAKSKATKVANGHDPNWHNVEQMLATKAANLEKDPHYYDESYRKFVEKQIELYGGLFNPEKSKLTRLQHIEENPNYWKDIYAKAMETKTINHGDPHYMEFGSESFYNHVAELHDGNPTYVNSEQAALTREKRYGDRNAFGWGSKEFLQRMIELYGVPHNSQVHEFAVSQRKLYLYDGKFFSSAPEIALYIFLADNNISFTYLPTCDFWYEYDGKQHKYEPDFLIESLYVEIKGNLFFKDKDPTKEMICPFRKKDWTDEQYQKECNKYEAKHQCMLLHNVKILTYDDYVIYLDYVASKYGNDYLKSFRKQKIATLI